MPSLRELLAQKNAEKEKSNAASTKVQQQNPQTAVGKEETNRTEGAIQQPAAGTTSPAVLVESGNGNAGARPANGEPPSNLTGLALIRWQRENAPKTTPNATKPEAGKTSPGISTNSIGPGDNSVREERVNQSVSTPAQSGSSGSRATDDQKTNDGAINQDELRRNLIYLAEHIEQKELVGQVVRTIAIQLKNNPSLAGHMTNSDMDLVVRGMRKAYQVAARKRTEKQETKSKGAKITDDLTRQLKEGLGDAFSGLKF